MKTLISIFCFALLFNSTFAQASGQAGQWLQSGTFQGNDEATSCFQLSEYEFMFVKKDNELVGLQIKNTKTGQIGSYAYDDVPSDESYFKPTNDLSELHSRFVVYYVQRNGLIGWQILRNGLSSLILSQRSYYVDTPLCSK